MNYFIIVFKNTLDAMTAERTLKEKDFEFKMMPTPTAITQSCGLCVRIEKKELIDYVINENLVAFKNIYEKSNDGYNNIA
ncbi:DUF3343 domain-containing protein [Clostridium sp.]|uniref:DUF3343 domain-containing protein n=1 Tax=Clostridium sp. TaxID=1506 RepID=UPI003F3C2390